MKIKLTQNKFAFIDDKNFNWLNKHKWYAQKHRKTYYAKRNTIIDQKQKIIYMHRLIIENKLKRKIKSNEETHHINKNGLDNREENLKIVTKSQHRMMKEKRKDCTSCYKGIYYHKQRKKWHARIQLNGKCISLGLFKNELNAAKAYDIAALKYFGQYAKTNLEIKND